MAEAVVAAIAAAGTAIGGSAGAALIMGAEAIANAVLVVSAVGANAAMSSYQKRQAAARQRAGYNASLQDREVMIRSAIAPRRMVLGRDRISGPIVYAESTGAKGEYLHLVIALAHGESEAIEEVWFNDVQLPAPDGSGFITSGEFAKHTVTTHMHAATIAGTTLTLPNVASKVLSVDRESTYSNADGMLTNELVTGWSHAAPSNTITGLTPGTYTVNYERTTSTPVVRIKKHLGGPGQVADADLVAESAGNWTGAHVGVGITYLYVRLQYDQDVWGQVGIPNITCVVKGGKAYDPRTGLTVWTENAALLSAQWLRDGEMGFGATSAQVPSAELSAEANICDETVALDAGGTTQARYTFNGSFTSDESPRDVLQDILSGMAGTAVWVQGRWLLRAGAYRTPAPTLNEDALAGTGVSIVPRASRSDLFNAVRVTHRDASQGWAEVQAPLVANAGYEAEDGGRQIVRDVTLPGVMDTWRAQRLAKIILERARQSTAVRLSTNLRGYDLAPTDTVPLSLARYGFADKVFEVRSRTYDPLGTLQYLLVETAAGVWAWNYGEATVGDLAPNTALPNPYAAPAALTGLAVDAGPSYILRNRGGTLIAQAMVSWTASTETFVVSGGRIDVQWKLTSATDWQDTPRVDGNQTGTLITPVPDGQAILVRARAVNAAGRASRWASAIAQVAQLSAYGARVFRVVAEGYSDTGAPASPTLWDAESGEDIAGFAYGRSYNLVVLRRSDGAVLYGKAYDVYGVGSSGGWTAADLAADLNAQGSDVVVVVWTYDEPKQNRLTSGLDAAMYRCGASRAVFGSSTFRARAAYVLIGIPGSGEGSGFEAYQGSVDNSTSAWCDVSFYLQSGQAIVSGGGRVLTIGTDQLEPGAATELVHVTLTNDTWTVPTGATGTQRILLPTSWTNPTAQTVSVEVSFTGFRTYTNPSGAYTSSAYHFMRAYLNGVFSSNWPGATNNPEDVNALGSSGVAKWAQSYVHTISVPPGQTLQVESVMSCQSHFTGTVLSSDGLSLRLAGIKR